MKQSAKGQIYFGIMADYWFDSNRVLHSLCKDGPRTIETLEQNFAFVKEITTNKKACLIADNFSSKACGMDILKYSLKEFPNVYKAIALVPHTAIGKMQSTIFTHLNSSDSIPIKMFSNKKEAKEWISQYL